MFFELALQYQNDFLPFCPCAVITDRAAWEQLDEEWRTETVRLGEAYLHFEWPYLSALDFLDFSRTGNRVRFENRLFSKRHALNALVLAECVENRGRFLDDIINGVFAICDENAWQLPPHNSYHRNCPQLPLPDLSDPVLDLFACETGAVLATACYLLEPVLDAFSPFITKRIRYELERRIFTPYLHRHFWWMGDGESPMNNWTIWCTQNVLLAAFLTETNALLRRTIFEKAAKSTDYFLAEYGVDGCCDEGAQYYRHAGLCLFQVLDIFCRITDGTFLPLAQEEKIRNIAAYIYRVHIDDKYYINFADCSPVAGRSGAREFLFAQMTGQEEMMRFAAADFKAGGLSTLLLPQENNLYYRLQTGFAAAQIKAFDTSVPVSHPDIFFPSVGLFLVRENNLVLAVKAGDNDDSHNHNDTGSFTIYKNGQPLFIDVGVESYTRKTFSAQRYEIWTMQSLYHNLPAIDGIQQKDGEQYCAKDVSCDLENHRIQMDIAGAYPSDTALSYYRRSAQLAGDGITIQDSFSFTDAADHTVVLSLMTCDKPEVSENRTACSAGIGSLQISGGTISSVEEIPITDARLATAWSRPIYRMLVTASDSGITLHIQ